MIYIVYDIYIYIYINMYVYTPFLLCPNIKPNHVLCPYEVLFCFIF